MTWILVEKEKKVQSAYDFFLDPSCVLCLAGSVAFVVSLAGWIGALRDSIEALQIVGTVELQWLELLGDHEN